MNTVIMMTMLMILGRLVIRGLFTHVYTMSEAKRTMMILKAR